jgi:hypothetical protein
MESSEFGVELFMRLLLADSYERVNVELPRPLPLDANSPEVFRDMAELAENADISAAVKFVAREFLSPISRSASVAALAAGQRSARAGTREVAAIARGGTNPSPSREGARGGASSGTGSGGTGSGGSESSETGNDASSAPARASQPLDSASDDEQPFF